MTDTENSGKGNSLGNSFQDGEIIELDNLSSPKSKGKRKKQNVSQKVSDILDLTDGSLEASPPKKSRRAADALDLTNIDTISISTGEESNDPDKAKMENIALEENEEETVKAETQLKETARPLRRSSRGCPKKVDVPKATKGKVPKGPETSKQPKSPKVPKVKKLSLTSALKIISAPIPELPSFSPEVQPSTSRAIIPTARVRSNCYDLTGDINLTDKHCSAPLFQNQVTRVIPDKPSVEDDDEAFQINVKINNKIQKFPYRINQKFADFFKLIADKENVPISNIFIHNGDKRIDIDDTPHSSCCKVSTILTCRIVEIKGLLLKQDQKHQIELKFQSNKWKRPLIIKMSKLDNFKTAVEILCEKVPFKPEQVSLTFDGDAVALTETPIDLEFEGGEIVDCLVKE